MNLPRPSSPFAGQKGRQAFTLAELVITIAVFMLMIAGVICNHLMGLKMHTMVQAKLGASDDARRAINLLISEVQSANTFQVGTANDATSFTPIANGQPRRGSALRIFPTANTNPATAIVYFLEAGVDSTRTLRRAFDGEITTVAEYLTNSIVFTEETFRGEVLTMSQPSRVLNLNLQFYQLQYPKARFATNQLFDYYQLQTKIAPRIR